MNTLLLVVALTVSHTSADTVVVCPPPFESALQPWIEYRQGQGHTIAVVANSGSAADIRARILQVGKGGRLKHVLLVGDAPSLHANDTSLCVPAHYVPSKVTRRWGSEPLIATDNDYADLDGDFVPDLAIGRLTADSPAELSAMIEKIVAYEQNGDFGPWRTRINFVAGAGGFGLLADTLLERVAGNIISQYIPATHSSSMTYASWQSCFCPDPRRFQAAVIERMNEGCAFWVYIGHGSERNLAGVSLSPDFRWDSIFSANQLRQVKPRGGPPIALFLACRTGAYDKSQDCLAEELLRSPDGPVAVMSGSRVTMPYAMTILGLSMLTETFEHRRPTLGEVFLSAKRTLVSPASSRRTGLATLLSMSRAFEILPSDLPPLTTRIAAVRLVRIVGTFPADLMQERVEHLALFNLFGDPLLRLRYPKLIRLDVPKHATAGQTIVVSGVLQGEPQSAKQKTGPDVWVRNSLRGVPATATAVRPPVGVRSSDSVKPPDNDKVRIELLRPRDHLRSHSATRRLFDASDAALSAYDATYRLANDGLVLATIAPVRGGKFSASIRLPPNCSGRCVVRVLSESSLHFAAGASDVQIAPVAVFKSGMQ